MKKFYDLSFSPQEPFRHWEEVMKRSQSDKSRKGLMVTEFLDLVEKDFKHRKGKSLKKDYANKLSDHPSTSNLGKICREVIEISPSDCIQVRLIAEACKLLANPKPTVKTVANQLGYEEVGQVSYFSRLFKNYTGLTPIAFRKAI